MMVRALMTNPDLLILDEATEGLAPKIAKEIWEIVRAVRASGIATVIVDKNFAAVNAITDRNLILVKGEVVYAGAASDLRANAPIARRRSSAVSETAARSAAGSSPRGSAWHADSPPRQWRRAP